MTKLAAVLALSLAPGLALAGKTYNDGTGGAWDCGKDPSVTINANNGAYTFTGACSAIAINGNGNTVTVASVKTLAINGNDGTVAAGATDVIAANGNNNTVTWGKGISGAKPKVNSPGNGNKIAQGAGGAAKAKPSAGQLK
jgi:hypothetical protein